MNRTPLPVVCFQDARHEDGARLPYLQAMTDAVIQSGTAWVSVVALGGRVPAIRACITSFRTQESDVDALVQSLATARPLS